MAQPEFSYDYPDEQASERRLRRVRRHALEALSENQSLLPVAGAALGVLLALLLGRAGGDPDPAAWAITANEARNGLISALSILFAGLSIILALASGTVQNVVGRFSLRMLRIYLRNPWDKAVIAAYAMAATFILVDWFQLRALPSEALAPVGGVLMSALLLFFSGAMMIWYLGALPNWFRVDRTVRRIAKLTLRAAHSVEKKHGEEAPAVEFPFQRPQDAIAVLAHRSGYLAEIDTEGLFELAVGHDVEVVIDRAIGWSAVQGEPIGWIAPGESAGGESAAGEGASDGPPPGRVADTIDITEVRALDRAVGYGIVVLVDMAIMALSPGVNDPNTAVQVIEEMTFLFPLLAQVRLGPFGRADAEGRQRVAVQASTFGDFVEMATTQIVLYSGGDPAVIKALQHWVRVLEGLDLTARDRQAVDSFALRVRGLAGERKGDNSA
jgi:uncharacterized membrane protein